MKAVMLGHAMITKKYPGGDVFELKILVQPNPYINNNAEIIESIGIKTAVVEISAQDEPEENEGWFYVYGVVDKTYSVFFESREDAEYFISQNLSASLDPGITTLQVIRDSTKEGGR